jgi:septal ring factor EnvC (AmiA/AmiB activator)
MRTRAFDRSFRRRAAALLPHGARRVTVTTAGLVVAIAAVVAPGAASAQFGGPPADSVTPRLALPATEPQADKRQSFLPTDITDVDQQREQIKGRLIETAALIQRSEGGVAAMGARVAELEAQERMLREGLDKGHDKITKLMAALQRMGRNPPPVLFTQRTDALRMVRSAILLSAAFPELRKDAMDLARRLSELIALVEEARRQKQKLETETRALADAQVKLEGLLAQKRTAQSDRAGELEQVRTAVAEIERSAGDLSDLIGRLDRAVAPAGLAAYDAELARAAAAGSGITVAAPGVAGAAKPKVGSGEQQVAALSPAPGAGMKPTIFELSPKMSLGASPARMKPAIPFEQAKARLPLPAQGRRLLAFGDKTSTGQQSKGMVMETRLNARVTSPSDGWVVYAGEFRSYGQLLIINAGSDYHVLLAGMSHIDVQPGDFVLAGEPVGTMPGANAKAQDGRSQASAPVLYVEFRKDGRPIDPSPWWTDGKEKVQG